MSLSSNNHVLLHTGLGGSWEKIEEGEKSAWEMEMDLVRCGQCHLAVEKNGFEEHDRMMFKVLVINKRKM